MTIKEKRERRANLWAECEAIFARGEMSAEDKSRYNGLTAEIDLLKEEIDAEESHEARRVEMDAVRRDASLLPGAETVEVRTVATDAEYRSAFDQYLRLGRNDMDREQRQTLQRGFNSVEARALSIATGAAGGFLVPEEFERQIVEQREWFGGMRRARTRKFTTSTGADLPFPVTDDTANVGAILIEGNAISEQDVEFGLKTLRSHVYTSKMVRVSLPLMQDTYFNIEEHLAKAFGERIGRIENTHLTQGDGASKPEGILTAATLGHTAAANTGIAYADLVRMVHSIDPAYRTPNGEWMMHDSSLEALRLLVDGESRPLRQPGLTGHEPDRLMGYPYVINNDMPEIAASTKTVLFGDFSYYWIRDIKGITVLRLDERFAEYLHVGFLAFSRVDGMLTNASAVKYLVHPA